MKVFTVWEKEIICTDLNREKKVNFHFGIKIFQAI